MTRILLLLSAALLLLVGGVAAQDLTQTVTNDNGVTVSFPADMIATDVGAVISLARMNGTLALVIEAGPVVNDRFGQDVQALEDMARLLGQGLSLAGADAQFEEVTLPNGNGLRLNASVSGIQTLFYLVNINGNNVIVTAVAPLGDVADSSSIVEAIASSITLPQGSAPALPDGPDTTDATTDADGRTLLPDGVSFEMPAGWQLVDATSNLQSGVVLGTDNFTDTITLTSLGEVPGMLRETVFLTTAQAVLALVTTAPLSADDLQRVETADGRELIFVNSAEVAPDAGRQAVIYFVPLGGDRLTYVQGLATSETTDDIFAAVEQVALTLRTAEASPVADGTLLEVGEIACFAQARDFVTATAPSASVTCPAACEPNAVWGTDTYTDDSSVCTAAAHAGVITLSEGGSFSITYAPGQDAYTGSERNGITTSDWPAWDGSFTVGQ